MPGGRAKGKGTMANVITTEEAPSISELLKERRGKTPKAAVYRELGVAANTYNTWESGMYVPGDEYAEALAEYLDIELPRFVWFLYRDRLERAKGVYVSSFSHAA